MPRTRQTSGATVASPLVSPDLVSQPVLPKRLVPEKNALPKSHADFRHGLGHQLAMDAQQATFAELRQRYPELDMLVEGAASMRQNALQLTLQDVTGQLLSRQQYMHFQLAGANKALLPGLLALTPSLQDDCCAPVSARQQQATTLVNQPPVSKTKAIASTWPVNQGHDHSHVLGIDADEIVHGLYASAGYGVTALSDPKQVREEIAHDAAQLSHEPWQYLRHDMASGGVADTGVAIGLTLPMFYFAWLAMHGGQHEVQHARQWLQQLQVLRTANRTEQASLRTLVSSNTDQAPAPPLLRRLSALRVDAARLMKARSTARMDLGIGLASFASGFAIAAKASMDLGLKIALGIKSSLSAKSFFVTHETVQVSAAAGSAATSVAFAGTVVLAPLAGLFATVLGALITRKSSQQLRRVKQGLRQYRQAMPMIMARLTAANGAKAWVEQCAAYARFIERQLGKRRSFYQRFLRWNKAFMVGSGIYAASATVKAVLVVLAIVGVAALASNPIGLGVLLGVGLTGALIMAAGSIAFFTGHEKQGRYSKHWLMDHSAVDRRLLSVLDRFANEADSPTLRSEGSSDDGHNPASSSMSPSSSDEALFADSGLIGRDALSPDVLSRVVDPSQATSLTASSTACMSDAGMSLRVRCLAWLDQRRGVFDQEGQPVSGLAWFWKTAAEALGEQGQPLYAPRDRRASLWQRWRGRCLSSKRVDAWLKTAPGLQAAKLFLQADVKEHMSYLQDKLAARLRVDRACLEAISADKPVCQDEKVNSTLPALQDLAVRWDADAEADQAKLERCRAMLQLLQKNDLSWQTLEAPLADYLGLAVPKAKQAHALGWVFLRGMYQDIKQARGVLACSGVAA